MDDRASIDIGASSPAAERNTVSEACGVALAACPARNGGTGVPMQAEGAAPTPSDEGAASGGAQGNGSVAAVPSAGDVLANTPAGACWQLPVVDRARLYAVPGKAGALVAGKIAGSNTSAMNDFVDLATVPAALEGDWTELRFANTTPYRYVKYYGPAQSYGAVTEVELYAGEVRLTGQGFGTTGSRDGSGNTFDRAFDGDVSTAFEGPLPNDNYVGLDLAAEHIPAAPAIQPAAGNYTSATTVSLATEPGATVYYTTDGSDPRSNGLRYSEPFSVAETAVVRAAATRECTLWSDTSQASYRVQGEGDAVSSARGSVQSSMHIGNSLTDTIIEYLEGMASSGGVALELNRYTVPGAGTWLYADMPSGGFGVANVQEALRTRPFDHVTVQPFPNMPCQVAASSDGPDSDSGYIDQAWSDARAQNPNVQLWIYHQWPSPVDIVNCVTGGAWTRGDWSPPAPQSWEEAVLNEGRYHEAIRAELIRLNPDARPPYVVPAGLALLDLKRSIEAGRVPGMTSFFAQLFQAGGTDIHLTSAGAYFVTLVFYACMFGQSPEGTANDPASELTDEQALVLQRLAWETVSGYALSGVPR